MTGLVRKNDAVRFAQGLLAVKADGIWGPNTQRAYVSASPAVRARVDHELAKAKLTVPAIHAYKQSGGAQDKQAVIDLIRAICAEQGVDPQPYLAKASIESGFRPWISNGRSRGLFQFQEDAWSDARRIDPRLGEYRTNVFDARINTYAAIAFNKALRLQLQRIGYAGPLDAAHLYLAHQQGAGGLNELHRASIGLGPRGRTLVSEEAMRSNPPQDRKGITVDKSEFYRRWVAVARERLQRRV